MQARRTHRLWAVLPFVVAVMAAGCVTTGPTLTASPAVSLPIEGPTGPLPTLSAGETASPAPLDTATPGTTSAPTEAPTDGAHPNWPPGAIGAGKADEHVGEQATVCGTVDTARWLYSEPGHPTWLNFNRPYPEMRFNAVIWGEERRAWPLNGKPEVIYLGRVICVTGLVEAYSTWTQIQNLTIADIQFVP